MTDAPSQSGSTATGLDILAAGIKVAPAEFERSARASLQHACRAGQLLIEAKNQTLHGQWLSWLDQNCNVSERSAQAYMQVARECRLNPQRAADMNLRDGLKLLAQKRRYNNRSAQPSRTVQTNHRRRESVSATSPFDTAAEAARCRTFVDETISRCPESERDQLLQDLCSRLEPLWQPRRRALLN
jgi:hypothetical protein